MRKFQVIILFALLLVIVALFYFGGLGKQIGLKGTKAIELISATSIVSNSDFTFKTVKGKEIEMHVEDKVFNIKGMENKTVFLKVFGWDCKYCKKEIPELVNLKKRLGESFEVVAIEAQNHTLEESLNKIKEYGINYDIIAGTSHQDFYAYLQAKYGWTGIIPLTIVISKEGKVLAFELGAKSYSLSELVKASLARE